MRNANLACALRRRRRAGDPMAEYDRLPPPLRAWLAAAKLPWSPRSAARVWRAAAAGPARQAEALARLDALEARRLAADRSPAPCQGT